MHDCGWVEGATCQEDHSLTSHPNTSPNLSEISQELLKYISAGNLASSPFQENILCTVHIIHWLICLASHWRNKDTLIENRALELEYNHSSQKRGCFIIVSLLTAHPQIPGESDHLSLIWLISERLVCLIYLKDLVYLKSGSQSEIA